MKILIAAALALFFIGCGSDESQKSEPSAVAAAPKEQPSPTKSPSVQETKEAIKESVQAAAETASQAGAQVEQGAQAVKEQLQEAAAEVQQSVSEALAKPSIDAKTLYTPCAGCHGSDASKSALGKSQIIRGWSKEKIAEALKGYKAGTYGGAMKGLMTSQASKLGNEQIEALAEHISKF